MIVTLVLYTLVYTSVYTLIDKLCDKVMISETVKSCYSVYVGLTLVICA